MGIINLKWHKACAVRGIGFTKEEQAAGWPESFALHRLAILQSPADNKMANILHRALIDACAAGSLPSAPATVQKIGHETKTYLETNSFVRRNIYGERDLDSRPRWVPVMKPGEVPAVTTADFAAWLAAQGEKPSEHIAAWFESQGVTDAATTKPAEPVAPKESKEERQDRRLQMCIDAGLPMNERALLRMPDGIGKVAEKAGVSRQTFTADVRAALARKIERERPKPRLVPKKR